MSGSDWIALVSVVFACLALGVSLYANRLQARAARSDAEKELADQIEAIQGQMAQLYDGGPSDPSMQAVAKEMNTNAALQALMVRIADLVDFAKLDLTWYQNLVLGWTSLMLLDFRGAERYVTGAHKMAMDGEERTNSTGPSARILSLILRGTFYYQRGNEGDVTTARNDFKEARKVVRHIAAQQGGAATAIRIIEIYLRETQFELGIGNDEKAKALMGKACAVCDGDLHSPALRRHMAGVLQSFAQKQPCMPANDLLPRDFGTAADGLSADRPAGPALFDPSRLAPIAGTPRSEPRA